MSGVDLEALAIKSIDQYARVETRLNGVETTLQHIRSDNAKLLADFNEALRTLTDMQRQLVNNVDDHKVLHKRVDDVKDELDEVRDHISVIRSTCSTNGKFREQVQHLDELIKQLEFAAKVFGYKLVGVPVWMAILAMVLCGFVVDMVHHRSTLQAIGVIK